jgi:hypothetical protein
VVGWVVERKQRNVQLVCLFIVICLAHVRQANNNTDARPVTLLTNESLVSGIGNRKNTEQTTRALPFTILRLM